MTTEQNYVELCNWAHDAEAAAEKMFLRLSDEEVRQLSGLVAGERASCEGRTPLQVSLMSALLEDEIAARDAIPF